ncbi:aminopeptidase N [Streptacidiphilus rugosus]|uniref:aminopeptidase N n=1 Tax=Streptacidiphilus rugosus TaxID=405783 RepID=UPI0009FDFAC4|nr:aminopeptidase N [Streptacidiphilus rugosus]
MSALTRAEAEVRRRLLDVRSVSVELDLTVGAEVFRSETVIKFSCRTPGARTFVDVKADTLRRVVLNGRELDRAALDDGRFPLDALAADNELVVDADMAYSRTGEGMHRFVDPADGEVYVYTQAFLDDGPRVFAAFDQPDLKAPYQVAVTAPAAWTVVANGTGEREQAGDSAVRTSFAPTAPISSYLVCVVAGPLHSVRAEHDGIPLGLHCRRSLAPYLDADAEELLTVTRQCFDAYHALFRQRYPFGGYDQCFVPEFNVGAMENPGCVTFRDTLLFRSAVPETEREHRAMIVAHEMAHMWFGDLVTMRWWEDLWLNESFAEYMGFRVVADSTRFTGAWTAFASTKAWGRDADQRPSTHPVAPEGVADTADALQNFDGISYAKGAAALRQLVAWLGDEAFFEGVNRHFEAHAFGNATLDDLLQALAGASGRDVHGWAESWLRTTGVDTLQPVDGFLQQTSADGSLRPHLITVGSYDRLPGGALTLRHRKELELVPGTPTPLPEPRGELLVPDDTDRAFAKIRLDEKSWSAVRESLGRIPDELARAVLWNSARDQVRDGELAGSAYLELVAAHLPGEDSVHLVQDVLAFARTVVADQYLPPSRRPWALAVIVEVCRALLRRTEGDETTTGLRLVAVRGLLGSATTPAEQAELREWLEDGAVPGGPELDPALRWQLLLRLCVLGAAGETEIAAEVARDPSATSTEGAARCRAALPSRENKLAAWEAVFADELSNYLLAATIDGLWQPEQRELLDELGLPGRFFPDAVAVAQRRGAAVARTLTTQAGFPMYAATAETLGQGERQLSRDDLGAALRRGLTDRLDDLRRAVRGRTVDGSESGGTDSGGTASGEAASGGTEGK